MNRFIVSLKKLLGKAQISREDRRKAEAARQQIRVNLEERAGQLYIVYTDNDTENSQAFTVLSQELTIKEALVLLEATRRAAVEYNMSVINDARKL